MEITATVLLFAGAVLGFMAFTHLSMNMSVPKATWLSHVVGGVLHKFIAWMVADGVWSVVGLGQMSAGNRGQGAFFGFVEGSGIGGLFGSLLCISSTLRKNAKKIKTQR
ncbi:hypothetical protein RM545_07070 [Zunongwangia sp. F260]|uniref:Uncharacterized protein n=1 Tax=Autumnicola lenta TaxID=3075593 RepID=A0ABU3CJA7_9FLAO|nr:hypothetical protein [Zunongwangia sp. F260]MDT0646444.1 hypothetical protein [Zunongwangia sp. F260]